MGRGGLMRGPPGEQTSGSLLYCEHYITAFVHLLLRGRLSSYLYGLKRANGQEKEMSGGSEFTPTVCS